MSIGKKRVTLETILDFFMESTEFDLEWMDFLKFFSGDCFRDEKGYRNEYRYRVETILPAAVNNTLWVVDCDKTYYEALCEKTYHEALKLFRKQIFKCLASQDIISYFSKGYTVHQLFNILAAHFCKMSEPEIMMLADKCVEDISGSILQALLYRVPYEKVCKAVSLYTGDTRKQVTEICALWEGVDAAVFLPESQQWIPAKLYSECVIDLNGRVYDL